MGMRHRFHGDPGRFEVVAAFIYDRYGGSVRYIVTFERVVFPFKGPKNIGLVSEPPENR